MSLRVEYEAFRETVLDRTDNATVRRTMLQIWIQGAATGIAVMAKAEAAPDTREYETLKADLLALVSLAEVTP